MKASRYVDIFIVPVKSKRTRPSLRVVRDNFRAVGVGLQPVGDHDRGLEAALRSGSSHMCGRRASVAWQCSGDHVPRPVLVPVGRSAAQLVVDDPAVGDVEG